MKIYDIFTFFNELELLEIRLNILDKYVDYFVIIEATETFSGKPKKLYFEKNKHFFKKYKHKIIHYTIKDVPKDEYDLRKRLLDKNLDDLNREIINNALTSNNVPKGQIHWLKEFYQKESIKKALTALKSDDICFISDVDEIWNPKVKIDYSKNDIFKLKQFVYTYYLNNRSDEPWAGTLVTKYKNIKNHCLNHLRTKSKTKYTYIKNGGWHFTNMGGAEQIKKKLESYGHQEFNNDEIKSKIEDRILNNQDFIGRKFKFWTDESDLPKYILENKNKYKNLFNNKSKKNIDHTIIIKIQGGLGNQLFQYALGKNLSLLSKATVKYDLSWFDKQTKRKNKLNNFNIVENFASTEEVKKLKKYEKKEGKLNILHNFFNADESIYIKEKCFNFNPQILNTKTPAYLDGYWQSEKYFKDIENTIRKEFTLKDKFKIKNTKLKEKIQNTNSVALHIRKTDYVTTKKETYWTCPMDYYYKATKKIAKQYNNLHIFVFSDDIEWTKNNLQTNFPTTFVDKNKDYEDLILMSKCKHNIIANSTFSWWGAWLNKNPNKIVVAPQKWFNNPNRNTNNLIPKSWIKI